MQHAIDQRGVNSAGYVPGPYIPVPESGVIGFVDGYCATVAAFLNESSQ